MPKDAKLNVKQITEQFLQYEHSGRRRKGTIKIDVPFEDAVKKIAQAKPEPKRRPKKD